MVLAILNILCAIWCWNAATKAFDFEYDKTGWLLIFLSALNAANGLDYFIP